MIYALDIAQWLLRKHCIKFCHAIVKEIMMHYCNQLQQDQEKICKRSETSTQRAVTSRFYEMDVKVCLRRRRNCRNLQRCYKVYDRNIKMLERPNIDNIFHSQCDKFTIFASNACTRPRGSNYAMF